MRLFDLLHAIDGTGSNFHWVHRGKICVSQFGQMQQRADEVSAWLLSEGLSAGERVMTILPNAPSWFHTEMAILQLGAIHVPMNPTTRPEKLSAVLNLVRPTMVIVPTSVWRKNISAMCETIGIDARTLVLNVSERSEAPSPSVLKAITQRKHLVRAEDTAVILFTSGSTDAPKGVMLSHSNILSSASEFAASDVFDDIESSLCVLPLSQSGARKVCYACLIRGVSISFAAPTQSLVDNLIRFETEHMAIVPYLAEALKAELLMRDRVSLNLNRVHCGGAALSPNLHEWFQAHDIQMYPVYGLTETASLLTYSTLKTNRPGHVGKKADQVQIMQTTGGELCVKGPNLMQGYLMPNGAFSTGKDEHGWFHTGDKVVTDENGNLRIAGRTKNTFKTSRGIHVTPEEVENLFMVSPWVQHALITGEHEAVLSVTLLLVEGCIGIEHGQIVGLIDSVNTKQPAHAKIDKYLILPHEHWQMFRDSSSLKLKREELTQHIVSHKFIEHATLG